MERPLLKDTTMVECSWIAPGHGTRWLSSGWSFLVHSIGGGVCSLDRSLFPGMYLFSALPDCSAVVYLIMANGTFTWRFSSSPIFFIVVKLWRTFLFTNPFLVTNGISMVKRGVRTMYHLLTAHSVPLNED